MSENLLKFFSDLKEAETKVDFSNEEWRCDSFSHDFFQGEEPAYFDEEIAPDFLRALLIPGQRYLDLGCGVFRLSQHLQDFEGFGLDLHHSSLLDPKIPSVVGNVHQLPFQGKFDLILLGFGQICLMEKEQLRKLLKRLKKLLNRSGKIYLDLPTIDYIQEYHDFNTWKLEEDQLEICAREYDPEPSQFHQKIKILNKLGEQRNYEFSYQFYSLYELLEMFRDLRLQVVYGNEDFEEEPIKEGSEWMIFVLQKN